MATINNAANTDGFDGLQEDYDLVLLNWDKTRVISDIEM